MMALAADDVVDLGVHVRFVAAFDVADADADADADAFVRVRSSL